MREQFVFGVGEAARNAKALGIPAISIIEFGVAGGMGLLSMEEIANRVEKQYEVKIEIYGFDLSTGLPKSNDYRDLPYTWKPGFFAMDQKQLEKRLHRAKLIIGNVANTATTFWESQKPAPLGFISFDLDLYSSTRDALVVLESHVFENFLPRVYCYFDDIIGDHDEVHCDYVGELLAIEEFNQKHGRKKICKIHGLQFKFGGAPRAWREQMYVLHLFEHPQYNTYIRQSTNWQLALPADIPTSGEKVDLGDIELDAILWQFCRSNGSVIAPAIRLNPGGTIEGHAHPNEFRWKAEGDGAIVFLSRDGRPTTRFDSIFLEPTTRKIIARGPYLPSPDGAQHVLVEVERRSASDSLQETISMNPLSPSAHGVLPVAALKQANELPNGRLQPRRDSLRRGRRLK